MQSFIRDFFGLGQFDPTEKIIIQHNKRLPLLMIICKVSFYKINVKINNYNFLLQSDLFGSLNDSGLLSRASEALMAVDVKHPVVSCSGENFIQNFRPTFNSKQNFFYILLHYYYYYYFSPSQYDTLLLKLFQNVYILQRRLA